MPKRSDINSVFIIGAGPIIIGQACEFDYSGTQACRTLKEEGLRIVLLNSNPATIMTDPSLADATYIEPINADIAAEIIEKEKIDAVLPTMGGQTALNCAMQLHGRGIFGNGRQVDGKPLLIGATAESIKKAEDRQIFKAMMDKIGLKSAPSAIVSDIASAMESLKTVGFPVIVRPSFTLGGSGGGIAYNNDEFYTLIGRGLAESPTNTVLMERSLIGWKEFEMEVVRDKHDNCIIVCSIENIDPMGVHTGDSITIAPAQTLTDKEYQRMRDASIAVLREIGVDTGGSNVQFAINPADGDMVVIEMNPRVSRSSALASKATGFPIAKVAAKLAIGYTLDEIRNDITGGKTPASFEPSIDYIVTKIPRFDFGKFAPTKDVLTTQMQSVGEVMAVGRTFTESLQKAIRGLETGDDGLHCADGYNALCALAEGNASSAEPPPTDALTVPHSRRLFAVADAFRHGMDIATVHRLTNIDPWFLNEINGLIEMEKDIVATLRAGIDTLPADKLRQWKQAGFSDHFLGFIHDAANNTDNGAQLITNARRQHGVFPVYKRIDTCAGEFPTDTAYLYSSYDEQCELSASKSENKIIILGSGPNRIGQGIEFDYCCVHGIMALKESGYETIMVNCNPETVSTDYDTANRLFFEPLTVEDVAEIIRRENPKGVIVQFGGQTPLSIAHELDKLGTPIIGTPVAAIDRAESREQFQQLLHECGLRQPKNMIVGMRRAPSAPTPEKSQLEDAEEAAVTAAQTVGYPLVVRPSYVLGGKQMEIIYNETELRTYFAAHPTILAGDVLLDRFLEDATEVDVDAVRDNEGECLVAGIMEHIELAGIHSGDSACSLPPYTLSEAVCAELRRQTRLLAEALGVVGLMNVQYAINGDTVYVLEVNPRASRTVPFISKATGISLAKIAAKAMAGINLRQQKIPSEAPIPNHYTVKEAVFPFNKFPAVDVLLGPEMKSTGESMGIAKDFPTAFLLAQDAQIISQTATVLPAAFFSVRDEDKAAALDIAKQLADIGYTIKATAGTATFFNDNGLPAEKTNKVKEGQPHIVDAIISGEIQIVVNTVNNNYDSRKDSFSIRRAALASKVIYFTTLSGSRALVDGLVYKHKNGFPAARSLQSWY